MAQVFRENTVLNELTQKIKQIQDSKQKGLGSFLLYIIIAVVAVIALIVIIYLVYSFSGKKKGSDTEASADVASDVASDAAAGVEAGK